MTPNVLFMQTADAVKYRHMLDITSQTVREYCGRHGHEYECRLGVIRGFHPWQATYNRILMLYNAMLSGFTGWVCYLDADAYIADLDFDIRGYLSDKNHFALIASMATPYEYWSVNAGVLLFNLSHPTACAIISEWRRIFYTISDETLAAAHDWIGNGDQDILNHVLKILPAAESNVLALSGEKPVINSHDALFIRQQLRAWGSFEERLVHLVGVTREILGVKDDPFDKESFVRGIYRVLLQREPDAAGFLAGLVEMERGVTPEEMMRNCTQCPEFRDLSRQMAGAA